MKIYFTNYIKLGYHTCTLASASSSSYNASVSNGLLGKPLSPFRHKSPKPPSPQSARNARVGFCYWYMIFYKIIKNWKIIYSAYQLSYHTCWMLIWMLICGDDVKNNKNSFAGNRGAMFVSGSTSTTIRLADALVNSNESGAFLLH